MPTPPLSLLLLLFSPCSSSLLAGVNPKLLMRPCLKMAVLPPYNSGITPIEIQIIQRQFASVRELPRVSESFQKNTTKTSRFEDFMEVDDYKEPTFRRLFTHQTWERYTGGTALGRLGRLICNWRFCAVLSRVWPVIAIAALWSYLVSVLVPTKILTKLAVGLGTALQMQGTAIAFLLVFRTDNAYSRLSEARECWANAVYLCREIVIKSVVALEYDVVCDISRYLSAYSWTLRDKLRTSKRRDDILEVLLAESECRWVSAQLSRPIALLNRVRQVLHRELQRKSLCATQHYSIDQDVARLDEIVTSCERLFSSPIPPNMARHGMRSLLLWLLLLPVVLAGTIPPLAVAAIVAVTSYIYVGIDELGVQVEQPFQMLPLWQLCHLVQFNIEEALSSPELPLQVVRERNTQVPEAERFDVDDDFVHPDEDDGLPPIWPRGANGT